MMVSSRVKPKTEIRNIFLVYTSDTAYTDEEILIQSDINAKVVGNQHSIWPEVVGNFELSQ